MPTPLSQVFLNLPDLPPLDLVPGPGTTSYTVPSRTDLEWAHDHPETSLHAIALLDIKSQLQQHFDNECASIPIEDDIMQDIKSSHRFIKRDMGKRVGAEADIKRVVDNLLEIVTAGTAPAFNNTHELLLQHAYLPPPKPDLILNARERATQRVLHLITVGINFGRPSATNGRTLLSDLEDLLVNKSQYVKFPEYAIMFKKERPVLDIPETASKLTADGKLKSLQLPQIGTIAEEFTPALWALVHQLWSQMVTFDLTFGIITDYSKTYLAIRVRASGILYFSYPIDPAQSASSLLAPFSGLFHIAFQDAVERRLMQAEAKAISVTRLPQDQPNTDNEQSRPPPDDNNADQRPPKRIRQSGTDKIFPKAPLPSSSSTRGFNLVPRLGQLGRESFSKNISSSGLAKLQVTNLVPTELSLVFRTSRLNTKYLTLLTKQISLDDTPAEASASPPPHLSSHTERTGFRTNTACSADTESSHTTPRGYNPDIGSNGSLVLLDETGYGASGRVYRGYLDPGPHGSVAVIAKVGTFKEMEEEKDVYMRLEQRSISMRGVPKLLGLYRSAEGTTERSYGFLVMSDEGKPVAESELSREEWWAYYASLVIRIINPCRSF